MVAPGLGGTMGLKSAPTRRGPELPQVVRPPRLSEATEDQETLLGLVYRQPGEEAGLRFLAFGRDLVPALGGGVELPQVAQERHLVGLPSKQVERLAGGVEPALVQAALDGASSSGRDLCPTLGR